MKCVFSLDPIGEQIVCWKPFLFVIKYQGRSRVPIHWQDDSDDSYDPGNSSWYNQHTNIDQQLPQHTLLVLLITSISTWHFEFKSDSMIHQFVDQSAVVWTHSWSPSMMWSCEGNLQRNCLKPRKIAESKTYLPLFADQLKVYNIGVQSKRWCVPLLRVGK